MVQTTRLSDGRRKVTSICEVTGFEKDNIKLKDGKLADIAPTILKIMGIDKPQEMTGINLMEDN